MQAWNQWGSGAANGPYGMAGFGGAPPVPVPQPGAGGGPVPAPVTGYPFQWPGYGAQTQTPYSPAGGQPPWQMSNPSWEQYQWQYSQWQQQFGGDKFGQPMGVPPPTAATSTAASSTSAQQSTGNKAIYSSPAVTAPPATTALSSDPLTSQGTPKRPNEETQAESEAKKQKTEEGKETLEEITETEKQFDEQFLHWESQFNAWREQNANHPDSEQYKAYEEKWMAWRDQLLQRREQMRRRREAKMAEAAAAKEKELAGSSSQQQPPNFGGYPQGPYPPYNYPQGPPNFMFGASGFPPYSGVPPPVMVPPVSKTASGKEDSSNGEFLKSGSNGGIPGLDLLSGGGAGKPFGDVPSMVFGPQGPIQTPSDSKPFDFPPPNNSKGFSMPQMNVPPPQISKNYRDGQRSYNQERNDDWGQEPRKFGGPPNWKQQNFQKEENEEDEYLKFHEYQEKANDKRWDNQPPRWEGSNQRRDGPNQQQRWDGSRDGPSQKQQQRWDGSRDGPNQSQQQRWDGSRDGQNQNQQQRWDGPRDGPNQNQQRWDGPNQNQSQKWDGPNQGQNQKWDGANQGQNQSWDSGQPKRSWSRFADNDPPPRDNWGPESGRSFQGPVDKTEPPKSDDSAGLRSSGSISGKQPSVHDPEIIIDYNHRPADIGPPDVHEPEQMIDYAHGKHVMPFSDQEKIYGEDSLRQSQYSSTSGSGDWDRGGRSYESRPWSSGSRWTEERRWEPRRGRSRERDERWKEKPREDDRRPSKDKKPYRAPSPPKLTESPLPEPEEPKNVQVLVDDILCLPGRCMRPGKIVVILRGPPGSGKSFVAKLIKDKELELGGSAPRILSLDDYFMVEMDMEEEDAETGKKVRKKTMEYEYEPGMEASYRNSLFKAFRKNVCDGYFPFIIVDSVHDKVSQFSSLVSFAQEKGFTVYVCEMDLDLQLCLKRNVHKRSEKEITEMIKTWEKTPSSLTLLDVRSLLQEAAIPEVKMEDSADPKKEDEKTEEETKEKPKVELEKTVELQEEEKPEADQWASAFTSKWDNLDSAFEKLDRLDGLAKARRPRPTLTDWLQLPEDYFETSVQTLHGKKRVRWADLEERREQEKMRAIGFVVGQTDWNRMLDPSGGQSKLTQTKYI